MKNLFLVLFLTVLGAVNAIADVTVTWNANPDAEYYRIYASQAAGAPALISGNITATEYIITGLPKDTACLISVKAFNACGNSSDFSDALAVVDHTPVTVATTRTGSSLIWNEYPVPSGISGFRMVLTTPNGGADITQVIPDTSTTSFDLCSLNLTPDVPYTVTLSAIGFSGDQAGPPSEPVTFTNHTPLKITGVKVK